MKQRYRLYRRRNGMFYCQDNTTGNQESLGTRNKAEAVRLLHARNEAQTQPAINLKIAQAYLTASDPSLVNRTWKDVMESIASSKTGSTKERWLVAIKDKAFDLIRNRPLFETRSEHFREVLDSGKVSTNVYLRRLHNFALDMNWLATPTLARKLWPKPIYKEKRGITEEEHHKIIKRESNRERRLYYQLLWHTGASQSDMANLRAEDVDWNDQTISFNRMKLRHRQVKPPIVRFGEATAAILRQLPSAGPLFPYLSTVPAKHRTTEFRQRYQGLGITGICLHSYRYAWAERAKQVGMPERYAQEMLGHNSKAVHRAYAKQAQVTIPSLEELEERKREEIRKRQAALATATVGKFPDKVIPVAFGKLELSTAQ